MSLDRVAPGVTLLLSQLRKRLLRTIILKGANYGKLQIFTKY